jgi:hypothetical protein
MSSNRFLNRGLSGLPESRWSNRATRTGATKASADEGGGTSFVMGGAGASSRYKNRQSRSKADVSGRYDSGKYAKEKRKRYKEDAKTSEGSLLAYLNSKEGNKIVVGIALYGVAILLIIILLSAFFTGEPNEGFYVPGEGVSPDFWE